MMIGIVAIFLGLGILLYVGWNSKPTASTQKHRHEFKASFRRGELATSIAFRYSDGDGEFLFHAERVVREWSLDLETTEPTPELYRLLEAHLKNGAGLAHFEPEVLSIDFSVPDQPKPIERDSKAERAIREITEKRDIAEALAKTVGLSPDDIGLEGAMQKHVRQDIAMLFHHPDHV